MGRTGWPGAAVAPTGPAVRGQGPRRVPHHAGAHRRPAGMASPAPGGCPWAGSGRTAIPRGGPGRVGSNRRVPRVTRRDRRLVGGVEPARPTAGEAPPVGGSRRPGRRGGPPETAARIVPRVAIGLVGRRATTATGREQDRAPGCGGARLGAGVLFGGECRWAPPRLGHRSPTNRISHARSWHAMTRRPGLGTQHATHRHVSKETPR